MKKIIFIAITTLLASASAFSQIIKRSTTITQHPAAAPAQPAAPAPPPAPVQAPARTMSPVMQKTAVNTIQADKLVFLNTKDKKNGVLVKKTLNNHFSPSNEMKLFAFTKDVRYPDNTVLHIRLKKNPSFTGQSAAVKANAKQTGEDNSNGLNCIISNVSLSATSTDFLNNNYSAQTAHIFPGAIYTYEHLYDGSFKEETANRNPIVIGCDNPNMQSPTYEMVANPNQATISTALAELFSRFQGASANESMAYQVFESANNADLNLKLGAGGSGYGFSFNNVFSTDEQDRHVYMTIDARKSLFTMSASLPDSGYFKKPVNGSSPFVIMGSVSYGVRVLANMEFTFMSKSDADNFKAAYSGFGVNANVNLDLLSKNSAASTNVNAYVIGGPSSGATVSFDKQDLQNKISTLLSSATYQNARPISYELYDMDGAVIGEQSATDQFTVRNCVPADAPTNLANPMVSIRSGDDGKDRDTHYTLELFNSNGQQAAMYVNNSNTDEYAANESDPVQMTAGTPTGEIKYQGSLPLPVMRAPVLNDFSNGGKLHISITPNGHDTWKIQTLTLTLNFQNQKPKTITWSGKTLSQDSRDKDLMFDNGFQTIQ